MRRVLSFFVLSVTQLFAQDTIQIYTCYGNAYQLIVEGRLLDTRKLHETLVTDSWIKNGWHNVKYFINDEIKNTPISLKINNESYLTKSDDEGYFEFEINTSKKPFVNEQSIELSLIEENLSNRCSAKILAETPQIGIISDFDDTVIVSDVTYKLNLIHNVFFKNYKQREVIKGMAQRFHMILSQNPSALPLPFFVITGSPKQLHNSINDFLDFHHFPPRTLITKKMHGENADDILDQVAYKKGKIEKLIALYPNTKWVCFGDSGEQDEEVYRQIANQHPKNIEAIYIRNVIDGTIN